MINSLLIYNIFWMSNFGNFFLVFAYNFLDTDLQVKI